MARSLLDDPRFEAIGRPGARRAAGPSTAERWKLALASSMFLVAAGVMLWHFGFFASGRGVSDHQVSAQDQKILDEQIKAQDLEIERGRATRNGS